VKKYFAGGYPPMLKIYNEFETISPSDLKYRHIFTDEPAKLMFWDQGDSYKKVISRSFQMCRNPKHLVDSLNHKFETRKNLKGLVPILNYEFVDDEQSYTKVFDKLGTDQVVIQAPIGMGGQNTFLFTQGQPWCLEGGTYSASRYVKDAVPLNMSAMVGDEQVEVFPPSRQLFTSEGEFMFRRGDFDKRNFPMQAIGKMVDYSRVVCKKVQCDGYRGILGIDYVYSPSENEVYLMEINPRFQSTSHHLEALLKESGLPSLLDYNERAFDGKEMPSAREMVGWR